MKIFLYSWEERLLLPSKTNHVLSYDDLLYTPRDRVRIESRVDQARHANVARVCSSLGVFSHTPIHCRNLSQADSRNPLERQKAKKALVYSVLGGADVDPFLFWLRAAGRKIRRGKTRFLLEDVNRRMIMVRFGFLDVSFNPTIYLE